MAFCKEEFISTIEGEFLGQNDVELFENWVNCERINLEYTLAGQENMANFEYGQIQDGSLLKIALQDMLVLSYREAFEKKINKYDTPRREYEEIISLCLKNTENVINY